MGDEDNIIICAYYYDVGVAFDFNVLNLENCGSGIHLSAAPFLPLLPALVYINNYEFCFNDLCIHNVIGSVTKLTVLRVLLIIGDNFIEEK